MDHEGIDIGAGFSHLFLQAEHCANHFPRIGLCDDVSEKIFLRFDQILQKKKKYAENGNRLISLLRDNLFNDDHKNNYTGVVTLFK